MTPTPLSDQAHAWSRVAPRYEHEFVDPFRPDVANPVLAALERLPHKDRLVVADFGCGVGPLLPWLAERFATVWAIDFAAGMLERAKAKAGHLPNVRFLHRSFHDLRELHGQLDLAVSFSSLVQPEVAEIDRILPSLRACFKPKGRFLGVVPAMDGVHYHTMLLLDRALKVGMPREAARRNAAHHADHDHFDFAFNQFHFQGIEQHFWMPAEIRYRFRKAGFHRVQLRKIRLAWAQFIGGKDLGHLPAPWDWCFSARAS